MEGLKAPGPIGMIATFYQKYWGVVGKSVVASVLSFFECGHMLKELNKTLLVLIPKVKNPQTVNDFCPINVCNVVYKIASKVMANSLRRILPFLISAQQNAFVVRRLISDNI